MPQIELGRLSGAADRLETAGRLLQVGRDSNQEALVVALNAAGYAFIHAAAALREAEIEIGTVLTGEN